MPARSKPVQLTGRRPTYFVYSAHDSRMQEVVRGRDYLEMRAVAIAQGYGAYVVTWLGDAQIARFRVQEDKTFCNAGVATTCISS